MNGKYPSFLFQYFSFPIVYCLSVIFLSFFTAYFLSGVDSVTDQKGCFHRGPHLVDNFCSYIKSMRSVVLL